MSSLAVGIAGAAGRGASFKQAFEAVDTLRVQAVCDRNPEGLERAGVGHVPYQHQVFQASGKPCGPRLWVSLGIEVLNLFYTWSGPHSLSKDLRSLSRPRLAAV